MKPKFKQGDFDGGTLAGTQAIAAVVSQDASTPAQLRTAPTQLVVESPQSSEEDSDFLWQVGSILGIGLACSAAALALYIRPQNLKRHQQQGSSQYQHRRDQPSRSTSIYSNNWISDNSYSSYDSSSSSSYSDSSSSYSSSDFGGGSSGGGGAGSDF
jgi:uncharacterized membrane protein YgcG